MTFPPSQRAILSDAVISATFNKVADAADLLTSFQIGAQEILHASNKPWLIVPVDKKTRTTWINSQYDFATVPNDTTIKVLNASIYQAGDTVHFS